MCFNFDSCTTNFVCHHISSLVEILRIRELFHKKRGSISLPSAGTSFHRCYLVDSIKGKAINVPCAIFINEQQRTKIPIVTSDRRCNYNVI